MIIGVDRCGDTSETDDIRSLHTTVESLGHEMLVIDGESGINTVSTLNPDVVLAVSKSLSYPLLVTRQIGPLLPFALPPYHTLGLLDHPLHWRRVLERESVPVLRWVTIERGREPRRDTRVSVLGFPLSITPISPGLSTETKKANNREELEKHVRLSRVEAPTMLISRDTEEGLVFVYHGFVPGEQVFRTGIELSPDMDRLSRSLVTHIAGVLELRGPVRIVLVWEQNRLFLKTIEPVVDIFENSDVHRALGTDYDVFLNGIIEAYLERK